MNKDNMFTGKGDVSMAILGSQKNLNPDKLCPECGNKTDILYNTFAGSPISVCINCYNRRCAKLISECPQAYGYTEEEAVEVIRELL